MTRHAALLLAFTLTACVGAPPVAPPPSVTVVTPDRRTLAQEIAASPALASFAAQLRASGSTRLGAAAPVTVFAADEAAYGRLASGVAAALLDPENHALLVRFVDYHLVEGALDPAELRRRVTGGGGRATLVTRSGEALTLTLTGDTLTLTDPDGDRAYLTQPPVLRPNGVLYIVNGVVAPTLD